MNADAREERGILHPSFLQKRGSDHTIVIQAWVKISRMTFKVERRNRRELDRGHCKENRLTGVALVAIVDLAKAAGSRLSPLLSRSAAAAETAGAARHLLVRLRHGRAAKATLALSSKRLGTRARSCCER